MKQYTTLIPGRWGWFCALGADNFISPLVHFYGEHGRHEFEIMRQFLKPGGLVLDIGANVGNFAMGMAHAVGDEGQVVAFEPQRFVHACLVANIALNSLLHIVRDVPAAVGDKPGTIGVPPYPMDAKVYNSGGVSLLDKHSMVEQVPIVTIDSYRLGRCDFMKIDVEGMEGAVIRGARDTIIAHRPAIMCEQLDHRAGTREELVTLFRELDYKAWKIWTPLHDSGNIRLCTEPIFVTNNDQNVVAVHESAPDPHIPEDIVSERLL